MSKQTLFIPTMLAVIALHAAAETQPTPSSNDGRVQTVQYERDNVTRVLTAEGVLTTIEVSPKETIKDFAMGDREAWTATKSGNLFVFKPKAEKPDTNLTLYTDKRAYLFELVSLPRKSKSVAYWVRFEYPYEAPSLEEQRAAKQIEDRKQIEQNLKNAKDEGTLNYDYWIVGPAALQPLAMHDNGRNTYLTFSAANPLPAAFVVEADNSESLIEYSKQGDTLVLPGVVEKLVLRRGSQVASITNRSVQRQTQSPATGTESDKVQRVIKNGKGE